MKKRWFCILFILVMSTGFLSAKKEESSNLPPLYKKWLEEEVVYIITPKEKKVFLQLTSDRERDLFIQAFWKKRDPNSLTEINEFKDEHYKRIEYANHNFGHISALPGWKTDRGRIYIILGPPKNIEQYDSVNNVNPVEIWFYQENEADRKSVV